MKREFRLVFALGRFSNLKQTWEGTLGCGNALFLFWVLLYRCGHIVKNHWATYALVVCSLFFCRLYFNKNYYKYDFPAGSVFKNPLCNAEDTGSGLGRSLVWKDPHVLKQPSPCATTTDVVLWSWRTATTEPEHPKVCVLQQEKPPQGEAHAPQLESSPLSLQLEKAYLQQWWPSTV